MKGYAERCGPWPNQVPHDVFQKSVVFKFESLNSFQLLLERLPLRMQEYVYFNVGTSRFAICPGKLSTSDSTSRRKLRASSSISAVLASSR